MAETVDIGGDGSVFVGEDKAVILELFSKANPTVAIDMRGMTMIFVISRKDTDTTYIILKTTTDGMVVSGTFNAVRASNQQRCTVTFSDDDLNLLKGTSVVPYQVNRYRYSWKQTTAGAATILARGYFSLDKANAA